MNLNRTLNLSHVMTVVILHYSNIDLLTFLIFEHPKAVLRGVEFPANGAGGSLQGTKDGVIHNLVLPGIATR